MRLQVVFSLFSIYFALVAGGKCANADEDSQNRCFDFNSKTIQTLHQPIPLGANAADSRSSGRLPTGAVWGAARGEVQKPLLEVLKGFYDHNLMKSSRVDEMKVADVQNHPANQLARHKVTFKIKPFPFVLVEWTEDWAYTLTQGTPSDPKEVVISYEKTQGTNYIKHLCGNVILRKNGDRQTDVFMYEETKATQRSERDTVSSLAATIQKLRTTGGGGADSTAHGGGDHPSGQAPSS